MNRKRVQAMGLVVLAVSFCGRARAESGEVLAYVEWVAPAGCGTAGELRERVKRRSERVRFVERGPAVRRARAEIRVLPNRALKATLVWWSDEGRELVRELEAPNCRDALDALALVLAVTLDPDADVAAEPAARGEGSAGPAEPRSSAPAREPASASETPRAAAPPSAPQPPSPSAPPKSSPSSSRSASQRESQPADSDSESSDSVDLAESDVAGERGSAWHLSPFAGVSGGARFGPAPLVLPGVGVFIGVGFTPGLPASALARLSLSRYGRGGFEADGGTAEFELDTLRLELCPLGFAPAVFAPGAVALHGCVAGELGAYETQGSRTVAGEEHDRPWRSLAASVRLAVRPVPALELELAGALERPLVRDRFEFNPRTFHEVRPLTGWVEVGVGLRIP